MSRGDAHKIEEWLDYHSRLGFRDFQIILDGDVDGTADLLHGLDLPGRLTVHPRAEVGDYYDGLSPDERQQRVAAWRAEHAEALASGEMRGTDVLAWRQHLHLPRVLAPYAEGRRGRGWLAFIDVDEFVVVPGGTIHDVTAGRTVPRLRLLSFDVDTTGYDPTRPVLEQHTRRWSRTDLLAHPDQRWSKRVKSLVRYRAATLNHTVHKISHGRAERLDPDVARLHHFRMPVQDLDLPYTVEDPVRLPPRSG
jgi:hypothetical protein